MTIKTVKSICKFGACEPQCGMEFDIENGVIVKVRPDASNPISLGYACKKGMAIPHYQNDPDRLLYPEQRAGEEFQQVEWSTATQNIGEKLRKLRVSAPESPV